MPDRYDLKTMREEIIADEAVLQDQPQGIASQEDIASLLAQSSRRKPKERNPKEGEPNENN